MPADPITSSTVDELFNFDSTDDETPFKDKKSRPARDDKPTLSPRRAKRQAGDHDEHGADLGLDEEVKITKKRKPIAKLDEARLLSAPGIPKLRALARSGNISKKLRLKGKGHEFADVARLLNYYQLWLDNLYPRAKFADGLQLVEKVGHSKRMQVMRKEWIDEGKPGYIRERLKKKDEEKETDDLYAGDIPATKEATHTVQVDKEDDSLFVPDSRGNNKPETNEDALPEDDELEALLAEQDSIVTAPRQSSSKPAQDLDSEGEDDLDALLAEHETRKAPATAAAHNPVVKSQRSSFDEEEDVDDLDDLDALLAEHDVRSKADTAQPATDKAPHPSAQDYEDNDLIQDDDDLGDLDDLDALLAEHESIHPASRPQPSGETLAPPAPSTHDDPAPDTEEVQVAAEQHDDTVDDAFQADIHEQPRAETHDELGEGAEDLEAGDMFSSSPVQGD